MCLKFISGDEKRMKDLCLHTPAINELLARYGVKFGIYKNGVFNEQLFSFDSIPRIIKKEEFDYLEKGLKQRVDALNAFLRDIYGKKHIVNDGVIPEEFIFSSSGFSPQCDGIVPPKGIFSHISGIDLVQSKNDEWYILEDNLRVPSGASYPMIARELCRLRTLCLTSLTKMELLITNGTEDISQRSLKTVTLSQ